MFISRILVKYNGSTSTLSDAEVKVIARSLS